MSTQNRPTIVGLVTPGLFWLATSVAQSQEAPRPVSQPSSSAPTSPPTYSVLLMSNGMVVQGEIVDDPAGGVYRLKARGGQVPYPKSNVKRAGHSLEDLYRYQVMALPPGDFDERMKLVKWCLVQNMPGHAREQLAEVLRLSPDDAEADRMAKNLDATAEAGKVDPAIRQTSGEVPDPDGAPGTLPPGLLKRGQRGYGNNLPEIFDLPPAVAVRRASEFAELVQPVLQVNCAGCHNEKYQGEFQLVQVRNMKDRRNPDIARSNLDAALRLVDPNDLARSALLSSGLVPHGSRKGPIFKGANDPQYRVIATWVRSLQVDRPEPTPRSGGATADNVTQVGYTSPGMADGFASDKSRRSGGTTAAVGDRATRIGQERPQVINNDINESADFSGGRATDFPMPFQLGNPDGAQPVAPVKSGRPAPTPKTKAARLPAAKPKPSAPTDEVEAPAVAPTTARLVAPNTVAVDISAHPRDLPGMNQAMYPASAANATADLDAKADGSGNNPAQLPGLPEAGPAPAPAKKKAKIDPALLEKMIKARSGTP